MTIPPGPPPEPMHLRAILVQVAQPDQLAAVWEDVLASDWDDEVLGPGVSRFAEEAKQHLAELAAELAAGTYQPGRLTSVTLPRPDGQTRQLHVPSVRDRIVERSILVVLTLMIDPWLGPFSYAYRPGLGVADAVQAIARLRDEGLCWVARADFHDCFSFVPLPVLRRMLAALIDGGPVFSPIEAPLSRVAAAPGAAAVVRGLAKGSPLSPTVSQMDHLLTMLPDCRTREELMGIEGAAARQYFDVLGQIMPGGMTFVGRSRRPPEDIINAALSYGYAIILGETVSALCAAGLDPPIGLLHAENDTRPSLALDLMEEFRALIVDQVVIAAARRAELRPEHGHRDSVHGVLLTKRRPRSARRRLRAPHASAH